MPSAETQFKPRHGHTSSKGGKTTFSPTYHSWMKMKARVRRHPNYINVSIDERWLEFENFLNDVGERPAGKTLDRWPNPDGNYELSNTRWATPKEQMRNRRNNRLLTYNEVTKVATEWAEESPVSKVTFFARLRAGWSMERIMTLELVPSGRRNRDASGKFTK